MKTDLDIYHRLVKRGLTRSRRSASVELFGAAANYLSTRADRGPSAAALIHLFRVLVRRRHYWLATTVAWTILFGRSADDQNPLAKATSEQGLGSRSIQSRIIP